MDGRTKLKEKRQLERSNGKEAITGSEAKKSEWREGLKARKKRGGWK
jgi:hypothetical protein